MEKKYLEFDQIANHYKKNDIIKSLHDGKFYKYSGFLELSGTDEIAIGYDTFNENLVVYQRGTLANVIREGVDHDLERISHIRKTCKRLGCTPYELLQKDYITELNN